jgi:homoserine O-acetyltransferase
MPSSSDLYFTAADARQDANDLGLDCQILQSDFGHIAGGPGRLPAETQIIFNAAANLLAKTQ